MARRIPLGELCISKVPTLPYGFDDIIDYIDISSVDNESKAIVAHQEIEGTEAPSRARQLLEVGDVLVSTVRPNLNAVAYVETAYKHTLVGSTGYCVLRTKKGVDNRFVFYFCQSPYFIEDMTAQATGASYPAVTASIVRNATVPDYSLEKQKEIAQCLDSVTTLLVLRKQQLAKLDELVKSRFVGMFGDCQNEALIGDVISISRGASPRPISAFITDRDDGVNWIKIGDVSENSLYITKTEEKITPEGAKKSRMVHKGDFILSNSMSFGRPYILGINGCVHDGWLIMSDFKETFNELYLYHAIRSDDVQYQFSGKVNGATVKNLNSDLVKNTFIKVPSMELQNQFAAFVEQTDKSKLAVQQSIDQLETLKKSLMQKYFG